MEDGGSKERIPSESTPSAPFWLRLSVPIAILTAAASLIGILGAETYARETPNWAAQAIATDIVNVAVAVPALLALAFAASRGSLRAHLAWTGVIGYLVYSFAIYSFDLHFGPLFLAYVAVFGLSIYALVGSLVATEPARVVATLTPQVPTRITAALLIALGASFYLLWLYVVLASLLSGTTPQELVETGLPSNPVHVIDLAVFLPTMLLTGVLLWRQRPLGYALAPTILGTAIAIGLGIVLLQPVLVLRGQAPAWPLAGGIGLVTTAEIFALARFLAGQRSPSPDLP